MRKILAAIKKRFRPTEEERKRKALKGLGRLPKHWKGSHSDLQKSKHHFHIIGRGY